MFNFPSGKPTYCKPSNHYAYNRKTRQRIAIAKAQNIKRLQKLCILDLTIEELETLLRTL